MTAGEQEPECSCEGVLIGAFVTETASGEEFGGHVGSGARQRRRC